MIRLVIAFVLFATPVFSCQTDGLYPDSSAECSPGDIFPEATEDIICVKGYSSTVRNVTKGMKDKVYDMYGIPESERKGYVIDHLIPLQIGGSNDIKNLFPQRKDGVINSKTKDKVESFLKREVCKGELELEEAQAWIVEDWLAIWEHTAEDEE